MPKMQPTAGQAAPLSVPLHLRQLLAETPDTPAQWATEREAALDVEACYRTAVADWKPQRPPTEVT